MWSSSNVNSDKIKYRLLQLKRGRKTYFTTQTGGLLRHLAREMKNSWNGPFTTVISFHDLQTPPLNRPSDAFKIKR